MYVAQRWSVTLHYVYDHEYSVVTLSLYYLYCDNCNRPHRAEVLAVHVPREDDEWLLYETAKLTQFTRLYPPLTPTTIDTHLHTTTNTATTAAGTTTTAAAIAAAAAEALEVEVQGEDDDQEDDQEEGREASATRDSAGSAVKGAKEKVKAVTYEEIIFQVRHVILFVIQYICIYTKT